MWQTSKGIKTKVRNKNIIQNRKIVRNAVLQYGKEILEKSVSEVIKWNDSDNNDEEHMKDENGEQW